MFVYPDSRVQFRKLLGTAGFLPDLSVRVGSGFSASEIEFWSYVSDLDEALKDAPTSTQTQYRDERD